MSDNTYSRPDVVNFWNRTTVRVIGDLVGRPNAIELFRNWVRWGYILDAGCGTGYTTRILADNPHYQKMVGVDRSPDMITRAAEFEKMNPKGIEYHVAELENIPFEESLFEGILCTGVLMHNDESEIKKIFNEFYRVLGNGGLAVVSVTHPSLIFPGSPARDDKSNWVKFIPLENKPYGISQRMIEVYMDIDKNVIRTELWHHPISLYRESAENSGLELMQIHEPIVKKEHLLIPEWGKAHGYPGYYQMLLLKR